MRSIMVQAWLLRSLRVTHDGTEKGAPLVVLARADFVAAMDHTVVAASETIMDGATFHFVLDPQWHAASMRPGLGRPRRSFPPHVEG